MKVYLAGPMTGLPDFNYPAFHAAAATLRAAGHEVLNPAEHFGGDQTREYSQYMRAAIGALLTAEAIFTLPGWRESEGAKFERLIAGKLGLPHLNESNFERGLVWGVWASPAPDMAVH
jgi:hypothetical protein